MRKFLSLMLLLIFIVGCSSNNSDKFLISTDSLDEKETNIAMMFNTASTNESIYKHHISNINSNYFISFDHYYNGEKIGGSAPITYGNYKTVNDIHTTIKTYVNDADSECQYYYATTDESLKSKKCLLKNASGTIHFLFPLKTTPVFEKKQAIILNVVAIDKEPRFLHENNSDLTLNDIIKKYPEVFVYSIEAY